MNNEQNNYVETNQSRENEISFSKELNTSKESVSFKEEVGSKETNKNSSTSAKKSNKPSKYALAGMTAVMATLIVSITALFTGMTNYNVEVNKLNVYANTIDFDLDVDFTYTPNKEEYVDFETINTGFYLVVANSKYDVAIPLSVSDELSCEVNLLPNEEGTKIDVNYNFCGKVENLEEGTFYAVRVISDIDGKTKEFYSKDVKTLGGLQTKFNSISFECKCQIDGNAYFKLDFIDENNYYSNFKYTLVEQSSEALGVDGVIIEYPHKKVTINNVIDLPGKYYILTISYDSSAYSDTLDETETKKALITQSINVTL